MASVPSTSFKNEGTNCSTKILYESAFGRKIVDEQFRHQSRLFIEYDTRNNRESVQQSNSPNRGEKSDSFWQYCHC